MISIAELCYPGPPGRYPICRNCHEAIIVTRHFKSGVIKCSCFCGDWQNPEDFSFVTSALKNPCGDEYEEDDACRVTAAEEARNAHYEAEALSWLTAHAEPEDQQSDCICLSKESEELAK